MASTAISRIYVVVEKRLGFDDPERDISEEMHYFTTRELAQRFMDVMKTLAIETKREYKERTGRELYLGYSMDSKRLHSTLPVKQGSFESDVVL